MRGARRRAEPVAGLSQDGTPACAAVGGAGRAVGGRRRPSRRRRRYCAGDGNCRRPPTDGGMAQRPGGCGFKWTAARGARWGLGARHGPPAGRERRQWGSVAAPPSAGCPGPDHEDHGRHGRRRPFLGAGVPADGAHRPTAVGVAEAQGRSSAAEGCSRCPTGSGAWFLHRVASISCELARPPSPTVQFASPARARSAPWCPPAGCQWRFGCGTFSRIAAPGGQGIVPPQQKAAVVGVAAAGGPRALYFFFLPRGSGGGRCGETPPWWSGRPAAADARRAPPAVRQDGFQGINAEWEGWLTAADATIRC